MGRHTAVTGGDCALDSHAVHAADSTGSVAAGENATTAALLDAALAALALLDGTAPAILRLPVSPTGAYERAAMLIARTWDPPEQLHRERRCALHCRWDALASAGLYLAGYDTQRRNAWGERVVALAIAEGFDPPDNPDASCPVCFEDFSSDLPTPDELSRSPPGRWACGHALNPRLHHAVCRGCDMVMQSNPRPI